MPVDISKLRDLFLSEAEEHLQKLNDNLLVLEKDTTNKEALNGLMRSSHTMKGSSATMQYTKLAFLTHVMEDVFDGARNGILKITPEIMSVLYNTVDILDDSLASIRKSNSELPVDDQAAILKKITGVATEGMSRSVQPPPSVELDIMVVPEKLSHIKVPVARLDSLLNLAEELVIDKMRLEQEKKANPSLEEIVNHMSRLLSELQYQVMQVRLVPVEQIFGRFPRMVRDLAVVLKKEVTFEVIGGELELDRTVIDKMGEPIMHLLCNAVDHGIQRTGTIKLIATREKEFALISVENDGTSIDWQKSIETAARKNIVSGQEARALADRVVAAGNKSPPPDVCEILFKGFSTREHVSETSGRGVGMTIVKRFIESIGGRVIVESPLPGGPGTRFTLQLPLTLAMMNVLLVEIAGQILAVPFGSIERSVMIPMDQIKRIGDREVAIVDGRDIPLARMKDGRTICERGQKKKEQVLIVRHGDTSVGLVINRLVEEQEMMIKPLAPVLRHIKGFSGSTILGNGKTVLVVDVGGLLENESLLQV